jgi:Alpha amylase, catalytic domain
MRPHPHLMEIAVWPWLERLSRREGRRVTLADVPEAEWDSFAARGFDCVFLMGVWRRSAIGREIALNLPSLRAEYDRVLPGWSDADVTGSPYCIQAYEPDERMGGWRGLDEARAHLAERGMALFLDFVPNHTAFDHPWLASHPERYVLGTRDDYERSPANFRALIADRRPIYVACGRDPYFPPWTDVAQLNYFNEDTRTAMVDTLQSIAAHCDGVRCDMAMLIFNDVFDRTWRSLLGDAWPIPAIEFWPRATADVPQLMYLAEVYWDLEQRILDHGFSFAYDKRLLDALHVPDAAARVRQLLTADRPEPSRLSRFIENHDEPRSAATLGSQLLASACVMASTSGMRFFFDGQFEGRRVKAPVQLGRWPDEPVDRSVKELYEHILAFATRAVLHDGAWRILDVGPAADHTWQNIVAYRWRAGDVLAVVAANLSATISEAHVSVSGDLVEADAFDFEDELTGLSYRWTRESLDARGLWVRLDGGRAHLFRVHANR